VVPNTREKACHTLGVTMRRNLFLYHSSIEILQVIAWLVVLVCYLGPLVDAFAVAERYHIVLVATPVLDYVLPLRALARELVTRGHRSGGRLSVTSVFELSFFLFQRDTMPLVT